MKKGLFISLLTLMLSNGLKAQSFSVTGLIGYTFTDHVSFSNAYAYLNESAHWGISAEFMTPTGFSFQLLFQDQSTHVPYYYYNTPNVQENKGKDAATINYIMANFLRYVQTGGIVSPYGGLGLGAGIISPESGSSATKFAWDCLLGIKIKVGASLGIKLQTQLYSISQVSGGGIYVGPGGGGAYVSTYSSLWQFGFTGGVCLDFGQRHHQ